jgi:hypothetical protein
MARANQHGYHINWIIAHILPHYIVLINISIIQRVSRQTSSTMHNREKTEMCLCICWGSEDVWMNLYPLYYCDSNHCSSLSDHLSFFRIDILLHSIHKDIYCLNKKSKGSVNQKMLILFLGKFFICHFKTYKLGIYHSKL